MHVRVLHLEGTACVNTCGRGLGDTASCLCVCVRERERERALAYGQMCARKAGMPAPAPLSYVHRIEATCQGLKIATVMATLH